jgi:hypothetical protein
MEAMPDSAEELPALYRSILALVDELERCDGREEAGRIRSQALLYYAAAWDVPNRRRLELLEDRLRRSIAARRRGPSRWLRLTSSVRVNG